MKKLLFTSTLLSFTIWLSAQSIVSTSPQHVSAVLEEYTGMHCTFCPDGHKIASEIKSDYPNQVVLVNVHAGSYAVPSGNEPDFRTPYGTTLANQTNLSGYPSGTVSRHVFSDLSSVMALNRGAWRTAAETVFNDISPVTVGASTTYNAATRTITIDVEAYYSEDAVNPTNRINIALLEDSVPGPQTGGTTYNPTNFVNGQYMHNHMLRDLVTGQWGDIISTTTKGSLHTNTYSYVIPNDINGIAIDPAQCHLAIYVTEGQTDVKHGILLGIDGDTHNGNTSPIYGVYDNLNQSVLDGTPSNNSNFTFNFSSNVTGSNDFVFELTSDAPSNWTADFEVNQTAYSSGQQHTVSIASGSAIPMNIKVTPGTSAALGEFTLTAKLASDPNFSFSQKVYVVSGVTELVVNSTGGFGNGQVYNWEQLYLDGLSNAGNTSHDATTALVMAEALDAGALSGVRNLYMNVGWTFPSFSDDQADALIDFMDNGGNVFVAGQDIGWDINDPSGNGTNTTKNLYTNYLHADYKADGNAANNQLTPVSTDGIFGNTANSTIIDAYGGNIYPDEMDPLNGAEAIFNYKGDASKVAGVRYLGGYKMVFLGVGIEMIQDVAVKDEILELSYKWFNDIISVDEFDLAMRKLSAFPNPTADVLSIDQLDSKQAYQISIYNISGQKVWGDTRTPEDGKVSVDINNLPTGVYSISLRSEKETVSSEIVKL